MKKFLNIKNFEHTKILNNKFRNFSSLFSSSTNHHIKFIYPKMNLNYHNINKKYFSTQIPKPENKINETNSHSNMIMLKATVSNSKNTSVNKVSKNKSEKELIKLKNMSNNTQKSKNTISLNDSYPNIDGDIAQMYESYYNDLNKLKILFESTNCKILMAHYELLLNDLKQKKIEYKLTVSMCVEFITNRHDVIKKFLPWLETHKDKIDKKYGILILEYYIDQTDISKINYLDLSDLADLTLYHFKIKNYKLLNQIERATIETAYDNHPNAFSMIIRSLGITQWKIRDENFGELLSKICLCNISKFNYNAYVLFLIESVYFEKAQPYLYKFLEENILGRFRKLYKSKTIERIAEGFCLMHQRHPGEYDNILKACSQYLINIKLVSLQMGEIRALCGLFILGYVDKSKFQNFNIHIKERKVLYPRIDAPAFAALFMANLKLFNIHDQYTLNKIHQGFDLMIKGNLPDLWFVLNYMHQIDILKYLDFKLICEGEKLEYFRTLQGGYYNNLEMIHLISRSEIRILKLLDDFLYFNRAKFEEYFLSVVMYLNKYKIDKDSEMYKKVFKKFKEALILIKDKELKDENYEKLQDTTYLLERYSKYDLIKVKVISLPLYFDLLDSRSLEEFIDANQDQIVNYLENVDLKYYSSIDNTNNTHNSEYLIFSLMVLRLFNKEESGMSSFPSKEILVDLHNPKYEIFNKIKEFSCLSLEEMHQYYKFNEVKIRFYSSLYVKDVLQ